LEEAREKAELQKLYYSLLHALAHSNLSGVLLRVDPAGVLEPLMGALTRGAATHVDAGMRRTCVQVYMRLIQEWCSSGSAEVGQESCMLWKREARFCLYIPRHVANTMFYNLSSSFVQTNA
jgi:exportin-T